MDDFLNTDLAEDLHAVQEVLADVVPGLDDVDLTQGTVTLPAMDDHTDAPPVDVTEPLAPGAVDPFLSALSAGTDTHVLGSIVVPSPFAPGYWA